MEIQIWNNKDSNGLFLYDNSANEFKKVYFTFNKNKISSFLIKTKDNYIQIINQLKILMKMKEMKFYSE